MFRAEDLERDGHIICIGAGQSAFSCAAKLRALGFTGPITLVGEEPHLPYQRPPLSKKYLMGEMDAERLLLRPASWYSDQKVKVRHSIRAVSIDRAARFVRLASGESLNYSKLVLATGCTPRRLADATTNGLGGLHYIRTIADIDLMEAEFSPGQNLVVIGGGYIGLETASMGIQRGLNVTIIEAAPRILQRVACKETSDYFRQLHTQRGVKILEGVQTARFEGSKGKVNHVLLADGTRLPCELAVVGIGVVPNAELAADASLATTNGIVVDTYCKTADPDIFAVGDCANFPHNGEQIRLESVPHAIAHGEAAASAIMGNDQPYVAKPWFWSDQYDVKLQIAGLNQGYDEVVRRTGGREQGDSVWYFKAGHLIAVDAMNAPTAYVVGKKLIDGGKSVLAMLVHNSDTDLKQLLA